MPARDHFRRRAMSIQMSDRKSSQSLAFFARQTVQDRAFFLTDIFAGYILLYEMYGKI